MNEADYLPDPVTPAAILQTLQAAFLDAKLDDEGDVLVQGYPRTYVLLRDKDIRLFSLFGVKEGKSRLAQLEFVNRVNDNLRIPRVAFHQRSDGDLSLAFDWYIPCALPISKLDLVTSIRRFAQALARLDDVDGVVA